MEERGKEERNLARTKSQHEHATRFIDSIVNHDLDSLGKIQFQAVDKPLGSPPFIVNPLSKDTVYFFKERSETDTKNHATVNQKKDPQLKHAIRMKKKEQRKKDKQHMKLPKIRIPIPSTTKKTKKEGLLKDTKPKHPPTKTLPQSKTIQDQPPSFFKKMISRPQSNGSNDKTNVKEDKKSKKEKNGDETMNVTDIIGKNKSAKTGSTRNILLPSEKNSEDSSDQSTSPLFPSVEPQGSEHIKKQKNHFFNKHTDKKVTKSQKKEKGSIKNSEQQMKQEEQSELTNHIEDFKVYIQQYKQEVMQKAGFLDQEEWKEQDFYPLVEPFSYVSIIQNEETRERRYLLLEPPLNSDEKGHYDFILDTMRTFSIDTEEIEKTGIEVVFEHKIDEIIIDYSLGLTALSKLKLLYWLKKELLGLGKLEPLMKDKDIEDISCDGSSVPLFLYHRRHGSIQSNVLFTDEEELSAFVMRLSQKCGKHISIANPMLDATMPDGSRIQMTLSTEVSTKGSTFTIRKFKDQPFSPADLIEFNTMSSEMMAYLWMAVQHGANALIAGGTASGKTSTLNAIALFIPRESKIVSIEETREINLPHPNWIPGVTRTGFGDMIDGKLTGEIDLYDLMKAALRQRPEYILVGEIRGHEAYVLFQAMATGHTTYSTVHADSTKSLIHRLEGEPINIPRIMLQSLDIVCIQTIARVKNKRARRCKHIIEVIDIDPTTKEILTNEVFRWDPVGDTYTYSGKSYLLDQIRVKANLSREDVISELNQRSRLLDWMVKKKIQTFEDVATLTANYYENPDEVMDNVKDK